MNLIKLIIFSFLLSIGYIFNAEAITLIPATAKIEGEPGEVKVHNIQFINDSNLTCDIDVKASEIDFNNKGLKVYNNPTGKKNVVKNINFSPTNFTLKPGESKSVTFNIRIPDGLQGSDDSMIFFTASPVFLDKTGRKSKMLIDTSLGSLVMVYAKGTEVIKSKIKKAEINTLKNKTISANLEVVNQGNCHIEGNGSVAVFDQNDRFITSFNIPKTIIYPGQNALIAGDTKVKLNKGQYHALITYQYNQDRNIVIDRAFEVK